MINHLGHSAITATEKWFIQCMCRWGGGGAHMHHGMCVTSEDNRHDLVLSFHHVVWWPEPLPVEPSKWLHVLRHGIIDLILVSNLVCG